MAGKTLTRADLSEAVHRQIGLSRSELADLVKTMLDMMSDHLVEGETVKLSSFGTFMVRSKNGRVGPQSQDRRGSADHAAPCAGVPAEPGDEERHQRT